MLAKIIFSRVFYGIAFLLGVFGLLYVGYYVYFMRHWFFRNPIEDGHGFSGPNDLYLRPAVFLIVSAVLLWWSHRGLKNLPKAGAPKLSDEERQKIVDLWQE